MPLSDEQSKTVMAIVVKLAQLGHEVSFAEPVTEGPLITTFRFMPKAAAKVAQIVNCAEDLALALCVKDVLVRRLPGEGAIGVSVPNAVRKPVHWRDTLRVDDELHEAHIPLNFGVDEQGRLFREDLTSLPHLLITGSTNGGKSVLMRSMISSLMFWRTSDEVQFVISDTKKVESGDFIGSPHLLFDPAKTMYETWERMDWLVAETERRLKILECWQKRNITDYRASNPQSKMPYIVLVIDELFHILGGEKRGEAKLGSAKLARIVSEARAAGIHVVAATQRSSVDVVAGIIKANFPARLTFRLPSETDSRTILGVSGAQHLLTQGDMLYSSSNYPALRRLHSAFATQEDIKQAVEFAKTRELTRA